MSYSRIRSMPGMLYGLKNNTHVYYPLDFNNSGDPRRDVNTNERQLHGGDLVIVVANEQDVRTRAWSLVLYIDGTLEEPHPRLGWLHNDQLQFIPDL